MNWIENNLLVLSRLKNAQGYVADIEYLLVSREKSVDSMLDCIDYITSKYAIWINQIGSMMKTAMHVTTSEKEYENSYVDVSKEDLTYQCEWLVECLTIGACVRVGKYQSVAQALQEEARYE